MNDINVRFHLTYTAQWRADHNDYSVRNKIACIKALRTATGLGLREAKYVVEDAKGRTFLTSLQAYGHLVALSQAAQGLIDMTVTNVELVDAQSQDVIDLTR